VQLARKRAKLNIMERRSTELISSRSTLGPKFFYCCESRTDRILRTTLLTGEQSAHRVSGYQFKMFCNWSELPEGTFSSQVEKMIAEQ
jgi:hypothetical protein